PRAVSVLALAHQAAEAREQATNALNEVVIGERTAPDVADLAAAMHAREAGAYTTAYARLEQAWTDQEAQQRYQMLLQRLGDAHPALVENVQATYDDPAWGPRLEGFRQAWTWGRACAYHRMAQD